MAPYAPRTYAKAQCRLFNNNYCICFHAPIYTMNFIQNQVFDITDGNILTKA